MAFVEGTDSDSALITQPEEVRTIQTSEGCPVPGEDWLLTAGVRPNLVESLPNLPPASRRAVPVILDNRRMATLPGLQLAQYQRSTTPRT